MTEAQRIADTIDPDLQVSPHGVVLIVDLQAAAAELRRLDAELTLCSQLKREYQERAGSLACEFTACYSSLVSQEEKNAALQAECEQLRQSLAAHEAAKPEHAIVAGALFDFLGFLTTSERRWAFSGADEASPAVEALEQWAAKRGLHLDEAIVNGWMEKRRAAPVVVASPLSDEQINNMAANVPAGLADPGAYDRGWAAGMRSAIATALDRECMACEQLARDLCMAIAAAPAPEAEPPRCTLCEYQHGHAIGCANNPVDIALKAAPAQAHQSADDPQTTIDMLRSWLVEADASCRALTEHLNSVIEIAETWQPDYATKMDLDTIRFAKERLPTRGQVAATKAKPEAQQSEPVAWINWSALTGEPRLGWQCESEIASEPLCKKAKS